MKYSTGVSSTAAELRRGSLQCQRFDSRRTAFSPFASRTVLPEAACVIGGRTADEAATEVTQPTASAVKRSEIRRMSRFYPLARIGNVPGAGLRRPPERA